MINVYADDKNPQITRWEFDNSTSWEDFHQVVDDLKIQAQQASESFSVIATTRGQMPRGNALSHLKRLIKVVSEYEVIERFVIINHKQNPIGQTFIGMALKLFSTRGKLHIVTSEEDAIELI